jgi:hypothetical protein
MIGEEKIAWHRRLPPGQAGYEDHKIQIMAKSPNTEVLKRKHAPHVYYASKPHLQ